MEDGEDNVVVVTFDDYLTYFTDTIICYKLPEVKHNSRTPSTT